MATRLLLLLAVTAATLSAFVDANDGDQDALDEHANSVEIEVEVDNAQGDTKNEDEGVKPRKHSMETRDHSISRKQVALDHLNANPKPKHRFNQYTEEESELARIFQYFHEDVLPVAIEEIEELAGFDTDDAPTDVDPDDFSIAARDILTKLTPQQGRLLKHVLVVSSIGMIDLTESQAAKKNETVTDPLVLALVRQGRHKYEHPEDQEHRVKTEKKRKRRVANDDACTAHANQATCNGNDGCLWLRTNLQTSAPKTGYHPNDFATQSQYHEDYPNIVDSNGKTFHSGGHVSASATLDFRCVPDCVNRKSQGACDTSDEFCTWNAAAAPRIGADGTIQTGNGGRDAIPKVADSNTHRLETTEECTLRPCNHFTDDGEAECNRRPHCYMDVYYERKDGTMPHNICRPKTCMQTANEAECRDMERLGLCVWDKEWRNENKKRVPMCVPSARHKSKGRTLAGLTSEEKWCNWNVHTCGSTPQYSTATGSLAEATQNFLLKGGVASISTTSSRRRDINDPKDINAGLSVSIFSSFTMVIESLLSGNTRVCDGGSFEDIIFNLLSGVSAVNIIEIILDKLPFTPSTLVNNFVKSISEAQFTFMFETLPSMLGLESLFGMFDVMQSAMGFVNGIITDIREGVVDTIGTVIDTIKSTIEGMFRRRLRREEDGEKPAAFVQAFNTLTQLGNLSASDPTLLKKFHQSLLMSTDLLDMGTQSVAQHIENQDQTVEANASKVAISVIITTGVTLDSIEETMSRLYEVIEKSDVSNDHENVTQFRQAKKKSLNAIRNDYEHIFQVSCHQMARLRAKFGGKLGTDTTGRCITPRKTGPGLERHTRLSIKFNNVPKANETAKERARRLTLPDLSALGPGSFNVASISPDSTKFLWELAETLIGIVKDKVLNFLNPGVLLSIVNDGVANLFGYDTDDFDWGVSLMPMDMFVDAMCGFQDIFSGQETVRRSFNTRATRTERGENVHTGSHADWSLNTWHPIINFREAPITPDTLFIQRDLMQSPHEEMYIEETLEELREFKAGIEPKDVRFQNGQVGKTRQIEGTDVRVGKFTSVTFPQTAAAIQLAQFTMQFILDLFGPLLQEKEKEKRNPVTEGRIGAWATGCWESIVKIFKYVVFVFNFLMKYLDFVMTHMQIHDGMIASSESEALWANTKLILQGQTVQQAQLSEALEGFKHNTHKFMATQNSQMDRRDKKLQEMKAAQEQRMNRLTDLATLAAKMELTPDELKPRPSTSDAKNRFPYATFHRSRTRFPSTVGGCPSDTVEKPACQSGNDCNPDSCYDASEEKGFQKMWTMLNNNRYPFGEHTLIEKEILDSKSCEDTQSCVCDGEWAPSKPEGLTFPDRHRSEIQASVMATRGCAENLANHLENGEYTAQGCGLRRDERIAGIRRDNVVDTSNAQIACQLLNFKWDVRNGCMAHTQDDNCPGQTLWSTGQCTVDNAFGAVNPTTIANGLSARTVVRTSGVRGVQRLHSYKFLYDVTEAKEFEIIVSATTFVASISVYSMHTSTSPKDKSKRNFYMEEVFRCDDCSRGIFTDATYDKQTGGIAQMRLGVGTYVVEVSGKGTRKTTENGDDFNVQVISATDGNACVASTLCSEYGATANALTASNCDCATPGERCDNSVWTVTCIPGYQPSIAGSTDCTAFSGRSACVLTAGVRLFMYAGDDFYPVGSNSPIRQSLRCGITADAIKDSVRERLTQAVTDAATGLSSANAAVLLALNFSNVQVHSTCFDSAPQTQQITIQVDVPIPSTWIPKDINTDISGTQTERENVIGDFKDILQFFTSKVVGSVGSPIIPATSLSTPPVVHGVSSASLSSLGQSSERLSFSRTVRDAEGLGFYDVFVPITNVVVIKEDDITSASMTFPVAGGYPCANVNSKSSYGCGGGDCAVPLSFCESKFSCIAEAGHKTKGTSENLCSSVGCDHIVVLDDASGVSATTPYVVVSTGAGAGMTMTATTSGSFLNFNVHLDITAPGSVQYDVDKILTLQNANPGPTFRLNPHGRSPTVLVNGLYALVTEVLGTKYIGTAAVPGTVQGTINNLAVSFKVVKVQAGGGVLALQPIAGWVILESRHSEFFTNGDGKAAIVIDSVDSGTPAQLTVYSHEAFRSVDLTTCCEPYDCGSTCGGGANCVLPKYRTQDTGECSVGGFSCLGGSVIPWNPPSGIRSYKCIVPDTTARRRRSNQPPTIKKLKLGSVNAKQGKATASKANNVVVQGKATASKANTVIVQPGMCLWDNTSQVDQSQSTAATGQSWFRDWWKPCATCKDSRRVGTKRVGSLRVCGGLLDNKKPAACRAVSIGGDEHTSFEEDLALKWGCSVDAFRFMSSTTKSLSGLVTVHPVTDTLEESITTTKSKVKVLKVDCDGCEYDQLCSSDNVQTFVREQVEQLVLRTEFSNTTTPNLWKCIAEDLHMVPFSKKITLGSNKVDYSFVNVAFVTMATNAPF